MQSTKSPGATDTGWFDCSGSPNVMAEVSLGEVGDFLELSGLRLHIRHDFTEADNDSGGGVGSLSYVQYAELKP